MKTFNFLLSILILSTGVLCGCSDDWNDHYNSRNDEINSDAVIIVQQNSIDYLKSDPALSKMHALFEETGIIETMKGRDQLFTILAVNNTSMDEQALPGDDPIYLAKSHISDIALSPSILTDGQRVMMWNGKYLSIKREEITEDGYSIFFNGSKTAKIVKTTDGYIYILDSWVNSPKSMYEIIEGLDDDYSIFREMILSRNVRKFDLEASTPIGVDNTGNTVYDSVFTITNPYFLDADFDLMSESLSATMLIPSNEVINNTLNKAKENLTKWGLTRNDTILENWFFQAAFFDKALSKQDFIDNIDLTSIFDKQWRTTVQEVDLDNPIDMSNGIAYYIKSMKIPTNVLIYRLKDYMKWYEYLTEADKNKYFVQENLTFDQIKTEVEPWSGWPSAGFPNIENRVIYFKLTDSEINEYTLQFTPFIYSPNPNGSYTAKPYLVPPGEYDLCLGFRQGLGHDVEVSFNGQVVRTITTSEFTSTTFHYDRGGQGYPEGYDTSKATNSKKNNYDRDGGRVGVITIEGSEPVEITLTFKGINVSQKACFHHWCLRPTKNCY